MQNNNNHNDDKDIADIKEIVNHYFKGAYEGNVEELNNAFHCDAHITGVLNGEYVDWTREQFITRVCTAPTAAERGEQYDKEIIAIDLHHNAAMVKTKVNVGTFKFIDYITLLKIDNKWIIRNKSFTN